MTKQYLEDYAVGQVYRSSRLRIDKDHIIAFAAQFDPQPYHLDDEAARKSIFGGLAASGWHTRTFDHASHRGRRVKAGRWHPWSRFRRAELAAPGPSRR
ncbi:MAG: MaoC/PaaZ C-terminal domain-containing protein [Pseudolabrys sp.]